MDRQDLNTGLIQADTLPVSDSTLADLDEKTFEEYFQKRYNYGSDPAKLGELEVPPIAIEELLVTH